MWSGRPGSNRRRPAWGNQPNCPTGSPDRFKALQNTESPRATNRLSREQPYSIQNRGRPSAQARTPRGQHSFASSRTRSSQVQLSRKSIPRLLTDYPRRPFSPPNVTHQRLGTRSGFQVSRPQRRCRQRVLLLRTGGVQLGKLN